MLHSCTARSFVRLYRFVAHAVGVDSAGPRYNTDNLYSDPCWAPSEGLSLEQRLQHVASVTLGLDLNKKSLFSEFYDLLRAVRPVLPLNTTARFEYNLLQPEPHEKGWVPFRISPHWRPVCWTIGTGLPWPGEGKTVWARRVTEPEPLPKDFFGPERCSFS